MTMQQPGVLTLSEARRAKVQKLSDNSHVRTMDHATALPWDRAIDKSMYPKDPEHLWINGTPFCDGLTDAQKLELAWLETGRDISMFIWLEQAIPPLYMGYIVKDGDRLSDEVREYLAVFSKEEIVHTLTFRRFMKMAGLQQWDPPAGLYELLTVTLPTMTPAAGVFFTLLIEWVAELSAMHTSQGERVEPMTRQLFKEHHLDEARHIAFGRWISESFFENGPPQEVEQVRQMTRRILPRLIDMFTYNPEIARHTSFVFPVPGDDMAKIEQVWRSEHNARLNATRFAELHAWVDKLGLL